MKQNKIRQAPPPQFAAPLQLQNNISMTVQHRWLIPKPLIRIFVALVGIYSAILTIHGFYRFPMDLRTVGFACVFSAVLFGAVYHLPRKLRWLAQILLLILEAAIYLRWDGFLAGYRAVYRTFFERIMKKKLSDSAALSWESGAVTATELWSEEQCTTFFICCVIFLLAMLVTYFVIVHPNFFVCFLATFPFLECGLLFGYRTDSLAVFGLVGFWMAILAIQCANGKGWDAVKNGLIRVGTKPIAAESAAMWMLLLALIGGGWIIRRTEDYERSEAIDNQRMELRAKFSSMSVNSFTEMLNQIPLPFESALLVDEIDLSSRGNLQFDGKDVLTVETDGSIPVRDYYLKGICRSTYTGSGWTLDKKALRQQKQLFESLEESGKLPQTLAFSDDVSPSELTMKIEALQSEPVNYLPYAAVYDGEACTPIDRVIYDSEIRLKSRKDYEVLLDERYIVSSGWAFETLSRTQQNVRSSFADMAAYEDFAVEYYTQLGQLSPELSAVQEDFLGYFTKGGTYGAALDSIRRYIWDRADYTLNPGDTPDGKDLAAYFLTENHAGYCAHYATAAVLLCRMAGIPARYCQGYVISKTDFNKSNFDEKTNQYRIPVPNYRAHAWVEVFIPMYGWMPYEFTEGVEDLWYSDASRQDILASMTAMTSTTTLSTTTSTTTTTTTVSTSTSASLTASTTARDGSPSADRTEPKKPLLTAKQKTAIAGFILCAAVIWFVWMLLRQNHYRIVRNRKHRMASAKSNEAANASYAFLVKLLRMQGISQGNRTHEAFAEYAQQKCGLLPEGAMETILSVQQAVVFGNQEIPRQDAETVAKLVSDYAAQLYAKATPREQLKLRWIHHIVA